MYKNGKPYTNENGFIDCALVTELSEDAQKSVHRWIKAELRAVKQFYANTPGSRELAEIFATESGIKMTNNQFKDAMLLAGYEPVDAYAVNWEYCISKNSPALKRYRAGENELNEKYTLKEAE